MKTMKKSKLRIRRERFKKYVNNRLKDLRQKREDLQKRKIPDDKELDKRITI